MRRITLVIGDDRRARRRSGFSLMEVILATAILLGSVVVLGELAGMGRRQSLRGRELAEAQHLCEQTLNELLTGLRPIEPLEQEPLRPAMPLAADQFDQDRLFDVSEGIGAFTSDDRSTAADEALLASEPQTPRWVHSIRLAPLEAHPGLAVLTVVIEQSPELASRPLRFELSRWINDPLATERDERELRRQPEELAAWSVGGTP